MTPAEERFVQWAKRKGWYVMKPGWPDFLCLDRKDNLFSVEVKMNYKPPSQRQARCFDWLERFSTLPIHVWDRESPNHMWKWYLARAIYEKRGIDFDSG